jgi:hypothetical protein
LARGQAPVASPNAAPAAGLGFRAPTPAGRGCTPCTRICAAMIAPPHDLVEPAPASEAPPVIHLPYVPPPKEEARRKTRRGSEKRKRSAGILVKLTPADHQRLKAEAAAAGMSAAGYLASGRLGDEIADRPRLRVRSRLPKLDTELLARNNAELNHIGSNENQRTRVLNELRMYAREIGADRLERIIADDLEQTRAIANDIRRTLAANRRAFGYDSEG